jgi:arylsulfatase A-like enzyme
MRCILSRRLFMGFLGTAALDLALPRTLQGGRETKKRPNILFIALDDLNDWIRILDPKAPIRTPNIERLAKRGTLFTHAYCASAACNPSRTAILTGLRPTTTGVYGNKADWRKALPDAVTLPQHFMAHGYRAEGAGKIFHHHYGGAFHDKASFDDFLLMPDPPDAPMPKKKLNGLTDYGSPNTDWGPWPPHEADAIDVRTADYVIKSLGKKHEKPFFLAAGIFRPHMPFFAPQRFFDCYPPDNVTMPEILEGDIDDLPSGAVKLLSSKKWFFKELMQIEAKAPGTWKEAVRAYQASATFADAQVGRILDALNKSDYAKNTIIVLWSDHGYHLGEKEHWEKFALWEKTNHVPFIIAAPGVTRPGSRCESPVSLLDIYPTLIELCGLKPKPELDGVSLVPLLRNPQAEWTRPALMTYMRGNHAVRDERWRYIRYADGTEELYDNQKDPHEWTNIASDPKNAKVISRLKRWLPATEALPAPAMKKPKPSP